jgi:alkylation response protein AidB-like acyl-CoA dehydrogenase
MSPSTELGQIAAATADDLIGQSPAFVGGTEPDRELVGTALSKMAAAGLFNLDYLNSDTDRISAEDMKRAVSVVLALAARSLSLATIYMVNAIFGGAFVAQIATPQQKRHLLPAIRDGKLQLAFAMTEPDAGSDAAAIATRADAIGQGFTINGEKIFTTGASSADCILVVARVSREDKRAVSLFLVPPGAEGIRIEPMARVSANVHASCRVTLRDVRLGPEQLLGGTKALGKAWPVMRFSGSLERIVVAATAAGLADAIIDRACSFARERRQFGQPIASFQSLQHLLVEMRTAQVGMQLFVEHALQMLAAGEAEQAASMAKYHCAQQLQEIVAKGMRIMGGRAFFSFEQMSRYYCEAPFSLYAGGTVEMQKSLIARSMGIG